MSKQAEAKRDGIINAQNYNFNHAFSSGHLVLSHFGTCKCSYCWDQSLLNLSCCRTFELRTSLDTPIFVPYGKFDALKTLCKPGLRVPNLPTNKTRVIKTTHISEFVNNPPYIDWGSTANQSGMRTMAPLRRFRQGPSYSRNRFVSQYIMRLLLRCIHHFES